MMKKIIKSFGIVALAAIVLQGCYPKEDLYYADLDIALTHYDTEYNFDNINSKVCVIVDTVAHVVEEGEEAEGKYDDHIIAEVLKNMQATGFDTVYLIKDTNDFIVGREPHCVLTISAWETDVYNYYYYPWGGWYWGWGWYWKSGTLKTNDQANYYYYPYYPWWGGSTYYAYTKGSIVLDLVSAEDIEKPDNLDELVDLPIVWTGLINGILSDSKSDQTTRITNQVEQCFIQSPYLFK